MQNETIVTVVGNLVGDAVVRESGTSIRGWLRVASSSRQFDRATEQWQDGETTFYDVVCWRRLALHVGASLRKGDRVLVRGRLYQRSYENGQGQQRTVLEIDADAIGPDLARWPVDLRRPARPVSAEQSAPATEETEPTPAAEELAVAGDALPTG